MASDNCDDDVTVSYADTTVAGTGNNSVITRVWTATDDNGNSSTYTQTITEWIQLHQLQMWQT